MTLLEQVLASLRDEYHSDGKSDLFDQLKSTLTGESGSVTYAAIAARLGLTEGAIKVAAHRLRHRYRELIRAEIQQTVASAEDVDDELQHLLPVLSGS